MVSEGVVEMLAPLLAAAGFDLFDVEVTSREVRVFVDRPGGVDLDALAEANRIVSAALDDLDPFEGRYTLEVSSPGLERRLRTAEHYAGARGEVVTVRTRPDAGLPRRLQGTLASSDDQGFELTGDEVPDGAVRIPYDAVDRVRTVFAWGNEGPPGRPAAGRAPKAKGATPAKGPKGAKGGAKGPKAKGGAGAAPTSGRPPGTTTPAPPDTTATERVTTP